MATKKKIGQKNICLQKYLLNLVKNIDEAINHINKYGTMHTDAIITKNKKTAKLLFKKYKKFYCNS